MFRVLAPRRSALAVAAAAVAVTVHETREKLPIYPAPPPVIVLQDTPSELEKQIGVARRTLTATFNDAHARVQNVISKWIGVEHAVESRVKSLIAPEEPLTPGLLYVGVAGLTGSVVARNRTLWRLFLPPTLLVLSMNHFLPRTSHNISEYLGELEDTYFPTLAQKHEVAKAHSAMAWEQAKDATQSGRERIAEGVVGALGWAEATTGLKLRETLGWGKRVAEEAEREAHAAATFVEEKSEAVKQAVQQKVESVQAPVVEHKETAPPVVEKKTEDVPPPAEKKVEEVKRLV